MRKNPGKNPGKSPAKGPARGRGRPGGRTLRAGRSTRARLAGWARPGDAGAEDALIRALDAADAGVYRLLDEDFPESERFPRLMKIRIREDPPGTAVMDVDGVRTGNPLRDNNYVDDGYRFHDVFHLAHMAHLGWSPVHRALMGRRRLSDPRTAQVQDGRRAIDAEEGVVALMFSYARQRDFLRHDTGVDPMTVRTVMEMTGGLEVSRRTRWDWEYAILDGYRCWRWIREWRGGDITVDLGQRLMDVFPPRGGTEVLPPIT